LLYVYFVVQAEVTESSEAAKQSINPISRLIQIQQAKKEKEPVYTMIDERGLPRRREFFIKVTVGTQSAVGSGPNKKVAKRAAAEVDYFYLILGMITLIYFIV
jgi:double-stranded RNA-binding protein Staufen